MAADEGVALLTTLGVSNPQRAFIRARTKNIFQIKTNELSSPDTAGVEALNDGFVTEAGGRIITLTVKERPNIRCV